MHPSQPAAREVSEPFLSMNPAFSPHPAAGFLTAVIASWFNFIPVSRIPRGHLGSELPCPSGSNGKGRGETFAEPAFLQDQGVGFGNLASCVHASKFNCMELDGEQAADCVGSSFEPSSVLETTVKLVWASGLLLSLFSVCGDRWL